jgi:hypothetical protein
VDPLPDPLLLRKYGSAENRTRTYGSVARNSDHYTREAVHPPIKVAKILIVRKWWGPQTGIFDEMLSWEFFVKIIFSRLKNRLLHITILTSQHLVVS